MKQYLAGMIFGFLALIPHPSFKEDTSIFPKNPISVKPYLIEPNFAPNLITTTTISLDDPSLPCGQWRSEMLEAGIKEDQIDRALYIVHRESRCNPQAWNRTLNADGSTDMGLAQINDRSWCKPSRYWPNGYLQAKGILNRCHDLFDPMINLRAMVELMRYSEGSQGCAFAPWRTKGWNPCSQ